MLFIILSCFVPLHRTIAQYPQQRDHEHAHQGHLWVLHAVLLRLGSLGRPAAGLCIRRNAPALDGFCSRSDGENL